METNQIPEMFRPDSDPETAAAISAVEDGVDKEQTQGLTTSHQANSQTKRYLSDAQIQEARKEIRENFESFSGKKAINGNHFTVSYVRSLEMDIILAKASCARAIETFRG